jgi:alkylhydroperoxidase/carboxymuconolactone decarboxylase family protein YurZ
VTVSNRSRWNEDTLSISTRKWNAIASAVCSGVNSSTVTESEEMSTTSGRLICIFAADK